MQHINRLLTPIFAIALVAACATTTDTEDRVDDGTMSGDDTAMDTTTRGLTDPNRLDPTNFQLRENLTNPDSVLSKRTVFFDYDSSRVRPEFMEVVRAHATYLAANPQAQVRLEGHADERGTREYNLGLGERRARSVMDMMVARGTSRGQADTVSYGEERPQQTCSSESCWSENRRVEIVYSN